MYKHLQSLISVVQDHLSGCHSALYSLHFLCLSSKQKQSCRSCREEEHTAWRGANWRHFQDKTVLVGLQDFFFVVDYNCLKVLILSSDIK